MTTDIFCKIVKGETNTKFLFENKNLVIFADIQPKAPLHYLVVSRKHIATINDVKEEDTELLGSMILAAADAARMLGLMDGYKLIFNVGEKAGQLVPHIHLHLLGGWDKKQA